MNAKTLLILALALTGCGDDGFHDDPEPSGTGIMFDDTSTGGQVDPDVPGTAVTPQDVTTGDETPETPETPGVTVPDEYCEVHSACKAIYSDYVAASDQCTVDYQMHQDHCKYRLCFIDASELYHLSINCEAVECGFKFDFECWEGNRIESHSCYAKTNCEGISCDLLRAKVLFQCGVQ